MHCSFEGCNRRIKTMSLEASVLCSCEQHFCTSHFGRDAHQCCFDYKTPKREMLKEQNQSVVFQKVEKIGS